MKKILLSLIFLFPLFSIAGIKYVTYNGAGSMDGSSWANAYDSTHLQTAISASSIDDQVWVSAGSYYPTVEVGGTGDRYKTFQMKEGVSIYGGFAGSETALDERTDFGMGGVNETILSGDIGTLGDNSDNCYHVFYHPDGMVLTNAAVLDGFTINGGNANAANPHSDGGGMCTYSSPTINNVTFLSNYASFGAGLYTRNSSSIITNVIFILNSASAYGGGMFNDSSFPVLNNVTFSKNNATSYGGGISCVYSDPTLNNCILWGNTAPSGSELYSFDGTITLNYSCYSNETGDISGGGILIATNNNITSNPKFVNSAGKDFRLFDYSPCVDTGENSYNSAGTDIRGQVRIQNTTIDMGAFEWTNRLDPDPEILYVDLSAVGNNNGSSWIDAYTDLQTALGNARPFDSIWVANGTYFPSVEVGGTGNKFKTFQMKEGVSIYGGFSGSETALGERTDFSMGGANETILSGDIGIPGDNSDNCYHVFYHPNGTNLTNSAILDGFTITGGNADGGPNTHYGWGGGMYNTACSPTINNVIFSNNSASFSGGAMVNKNNSSPKISNAIFLSNLGFYGAGMANEDSAPFITNVKFLSNSSPNSGGGISNWYSSPIITNTLFSLNSAAQDGAGILSYYSNPIITNSTFTLNSSGNDGGGLFNYSSSPILNNCIIWGNTATFLGAQNYNYADASFTTLNYSCYENNHENDLAGPIVITNCITDAPLFINAELGDFRLIGSSPCVDNGNNVYVQFPNSVITTDIRGEDRIQNSTIDMGAFEWTSGLDSVGIKNNLSVVRQTISSGETTCFNAYDTIIVAGSGTFVTIENRASVEFIAGQSIRFLPGFHAAEGSIVDAHITSDSTFCDGVSGSSIVALPVEKSVLEQSEPEVRTVMPGDKMVKLYPNPNNGRFTIALTNIGSEAMVSVYNIFGSRVFITSVNNQTKLGINLPELRKGIYFVRVIDRKEQFTKKMIVN